MHRRGKQIHLEQPTPISLREQTILWQGQTRNSAPQKGRLDPQRYASFRPEPTPIRPCRSVSKWLGVGICFFRNEK